MTTVYSNTVVFTVNSATVTGYPTTPGTFAEVGTNTPRDVVPTAVQNYWSSGGPEPPYYAGGPANVFQAWTSGIFAPDLGSHGSYICWGGGHNDYYGNEVYRFDVSSKVWSRLGEPSNYAGSTLTGNSLGAFPDGKPGPPHSYQTLGYLSPANGGGTNGSLIQATLPAVYLSGSGSDARWWKFNLATSTWSQFFDSSGIPAGALSPRTMIQEPGSHFWWFGSGLCPVSRVTSAGAITTYGIEFNRSTYDGGAVVPGPRVLVLHGVLVSGIETWLLNLPNVEAGQTGSTAVKRIFPTGTPSGATDGLVWVPDRSAFASIACASPTTVRWLTPSNASDPWNSTWAWTTETYSGSPALGTTPNGAFSRFVWVPAAKCLLWAVDVNRKMAAFRPFGT